MLTALAWLAQSGLIWTVFAFFSLIMALLSEADARRGLVLICVGLIVVHFAKVYFLQAPFWLFTAMVWVAIGAYIATLGSGLFAAAALSLMAASVCLFVARMSGGAHGYENNLVLLSNAFGVAAILFLSGPVFSNAVSGIRGMADRGGVAVLGRGLPSVEATKKVGPAHE